jgi:SAM-dependent methyltransferase
MPDKLHLCCGPNSLPGWLNHDLDIDISRPLPFPDESIQFVFVEHGVEHVTPAEAWSFLKELRRILKLGGGARIIVPCVDLIFRRYDEQYAEVLRNLSNTDGSRESAIHSIVTKWGHKAIWTTDALQVLLGALCFRTMVASPGISYFKEMEGIDRHARSIGEHANWVESGVVEAVKWTHSLPDGTKAYPEWEKNGGDIFRTL